LEGEIAIVEKRLKELNNELNTTGIAPAKLDEILKQIAVLNSNLDEKSMRWIELSELKEG